MSAQPRACRFEVSPRRLARRETRAHIEWVRKLARTIRQMLEARVMREATVADGDDQRATAPPG